MCPRWLAALLSLFLTGLLVYSFVTVVGIGDAALNAASKLPLYIEAAIESVRPAPRPSPARRQAPPGAGLDRSDRGVGAGGGRAGPAQAMPKARSPTP